MQLEGPDNGDSDEAHGEPLSVPPKDPHNGSEQDWPSTPHGLVGPAEGHIPQSFAPCYILPHHVLPHPQTASYPFAVAPTHFVPLPHPSTFTIQPTFARPFQFAPPPVFLHPVESHFVAASTQHGMSRFPIFPPRPPPHPMQMPHPYNLSFSQPGPSTNQLVFPHIHVSPPSPMNYKTPSRSDIEGKTRTKNKQSKRSKITKISHAAYIGPNSQLLHEFRTSLDNRRWDLKELKGHIVEFCKDQYGSRFVQDAIESAGKLELDMVVEETVSNDVVEVSRDVFGNYVVQRILEHGLEAHRTAFFGLLLGRIRELSFHVYGCRVVQKLLDVIPPEKQAQVIRELGPHIAACVQDAHGNHVVQKILEAVPSKHLEFIGAFKGRAVEFAKHSYGCRVLQRCLEHLPFPQAQPLLEELMGHAFEMINDQFGNYVIQYILEYGPERERGYILSLIRGKVLHLSRHKHASNVCEKALMHSSPHIRQQLIDEVLVLVNNFPLGVWEMIHDQYGNYVLQRALAQANGYQQSVLFTIVQQLIHDAWAQHPKPSESKHITAIERILMKHIPLRSPCH